MQAFGFSIRPSVRVPFPHPIDRRRHHLDSRIVAVVYMSVLSLCDADSGVGVGADQGPYSCHGVVHVSDPLLKFSFGLVRNCK